LIPRTEYALAEDGVHVAYQVFGDGALDLVFANRMAATIGYMWEIPDFARFLRRLGTMARVIALDLRGTGLSDRSLPPRATLALEQRMMDIQAVMDAARSPRACLFGVEDGGSLCALFAATYPERTDRLILYGTPARGLLAADYPGSDPSASEAFTSWVAAHPAGSPALEEDWNDYIAECEENYGRWDWNVGQILTVAPSKRDDEDFIRRLINFIRLGAGFETIREVWEIQRDIDIRAVLPSIQAPTLVLYRAGNAIQYPGQGRYIAESIPGARFLSLPGADFEAYVGDQDALLDEIQEFLTGTRPAPVTGRVLTTVMFTDIVESTKRAVELGDAKWRDLQRLHHQRVRGCLREYRGQEIDTAGDGFLATFDGPARAVGCAAAIMRALSDLGISIRAGVHTGEVELASGGISGIAVHAGARIAALAGPSEVLVSATVKDLVPGSGLRFEERGTHILKGLPGQYTLFAAVTGP
jgi:class 3 adenylate cyclase